MTRFGWYIALAMLVASAMARANVHIFLKVLVVYLLVLTLLTLHVIERQHRGR